MRKRSRAAGSVLLAPLLVLTLASCNGEPPDAASLVIEMNAGITYVRDTGAEAVIDDVRYEGVLTVDDDGCLSVEVTEGPRGLYRAVLPPDVEVTTDSVRAEDRHAYDFGAPVHFARAYAPYFDEGASGPDPCNGSLELFGLALQR